MQALLSKLPAFALPFVTRSLRGGRGKRYLILSLVLASLTGIIGLWLSLGAGRFEQEMRTEFKLEQHEYERERDEFTVYVHDVWELRAVERELARLGSTPSYDVDYSQASELYSWGHELVRQAASSPARHPHHQQLREQARRLVGNDHVLYEPWMASFAWANEQEVARLEAVLEHSGVPAVEMYRSPLGFGEALKITGFLAGLILAGLTTVFAPLLVAMQQAQERHENTLMPLTGTALSPRELAVGLAAGPVAVVSIFAVPQLFVFLLCVIGAGEVLVAGALLAAMLTTGALFVFAAQLLGQLTGHRRTPGIIGMSMMALCGVAWLLGGALAADAEHEIAGVAAVLPHIGLSALLAEVFIEIPADFSWVFVGTFAWTCGAVVLGWLVVTALSRTIEGREGPLLGRTQALLGALTCIVLVNIAVPDTGRDAEALRHYMGLGLLALPMMLLLMGRVPLGDGPARMRRVPVLMLLAEFAAWAAAHVLFAGLVWGVDAQTLHPVALAWMAWCVGVLGLIAIRIVSVPANIWTNVWTGFCAVSLMVGFGQSVFWGLENGHRDIEDVFVFMQISPVLGLMQIALTVWIPLSMVRHLGRHLGKLR